MFALLSHNYGFTVDQILDLTMVQINLYISQIFYVSPLERIRYYLRDIKHILFGAFTRDYKPQAELDEDETLDDIEKKKLAEIQKQAKLYGIPPPTK